MCVATSARAPALVASLSSHKWCPSVSAGPRRPGAVHAVAHGYVTCEDIRHRDMEGAVCRRSCAHVPSLDRHGSRRTRAQGCRTRTYARWFRYGFERGLACHKGPPGICDNTAADSNLGADGKLAELVTELVVVCVAATGWPVNGWPFGIGDNTASTDNEAAAAGCSGGCNAA